MSSRKSRGTWWMAGWHWRQGYTVLICLLALSTAATGLRGFFLAHAQRADAEQAEADPQDWSQPLYETVQLFLLNAGIEQPNNVWLECARVLASLLFLLISGAVIWRILRETTLFPMRLIRRGHTVICGLGQIGLQILDDLAADGQASKSVVIEPDEKNVWLEHARALGADVVLGDATRRDVLEEARAVYAKQVFAVTGDDGANLEIAAEMLALARTRPPSSTWPRVFPHVVDGNVGAAFQQVLEGRNRIDIEVFNVMRNAAVNLITEKLWSCAARTPEEVNHFVIVGFGPAGQTLAIQLAQLGHFPNRKRTRMTIADRQIVERGREFLSRYCRFTAWTDNSLGVEQFQAEADPWDGIQWPLPPSIQTDGEHAIEYVTNTRFEVLPDDPADERFANTLVNQFGAGIKPAVFICGQRDRDSFQAAVRLRERFDCLGGPHLDGREIPIFVWLPREPGLAELLGGGAGQRLFPFGDCQVAAALSAIMAPQRDDFARKIQAAYEARQAERDPAYQPTSWDDLTEVFRESNRRAADHLAIKTAVLGYRIVRRGPHERRRPVELPSIPPDQEAILSEMEHNRWVAERLLGGWRFAPVTDRIKKRHNRLVPWQHLPPESKQLDIEQVRLVLMEAQRGDYLLVPLEPNVR